MLCACVVLPSFHVCDFNVSLTRLYATLVNERGGCGSARSTGRRVRSSIHSPQSQSCVCRRRALRQSQQLGWQAAPARSFSSLVLAAVGTHRNSANVAAVLSSCCGTCEPRVRFFFSPCVFNFCAKGYPPSPTPHGQSHPHDLLRFVLLLLLLPPRSLPSSFVAGVVAAALALFLYMQVHRTARVLHVLACPAPS